VRNLLGLVVAALLSASLVHARELVTMERPDGTKQCEPKPDEQALLSAAKKELRRAGVRVVEMRREQDGKMRMQMCGSPTGFAIRIRIAASDREKARALGFAPPAN
jgi:hypothetical protein